MDYLHRVLKNNYPDWIIKDLEKKLTSPTVNLDIGLDMNNIFISVPYVTHVSEECRQIC